MSSTTRSILAMVAACVIWGTSPLYFALLRHVPAMDVLAWRMLWSLAFFAGYLALRGRISDLPRALGTKRRAAMIALAAALISVNWFGLIFSIQSGRATESSLGYFIFPLAAVLMGRIVFREALSFAQWGAVGLATGAVLLLSYGLGAAPWIALAMATTFAGYGVVKKRLDVSPLVSVTAEVVLLAPLALAWLVFGGRGLDWPVGTLALLAVSGVQTGLPLILFSYAAQGARLSTVGIVQYVNPTLQFAIATLVFAEPITRWHAIAFPVIWLALAIYTVALIRQERSRRTLARGAPPAGGAAPIR